VSAEIAASLQEAAFDYLDAPVGRVHAPHSPVPQSPALLSAYLPDSALVEATALRLMAR
jgi:acetoin:2,6-dichlorophenolindophenol oxidoreductase subunit beta